MNYDPGKTTCYGFEWGPIEVARLAAFEPRKGRECRVVGIRTPRDEIDIYVSKTGLIRVWRRGKGELK